MENQDISTENVPIETYFLRYAFPCSHIICNVRKEISENKYNEMEEAARTGKFIPRSELEKIFFRAFERIDKIAKELGRDRWDSEVIREYFVERHNAIVDASDNPESFKDQCRVHKAKVLQINEKNLLVSYPPNKTREVKRDYVPEAKVGDTVTIHYSYAVEIL